MSTWILMESIYLDSRTKVQMLSDLKQDTWMLCCLVLFTLHSELTISCGNGGQIPGLHSPAGLGRCMAPVPLGKLQNIMFCETWSPMQRFENGEVFEIM